MEPKYFESHITIEPVFGERYDKFSEACKKYKFKAAELLLQKNREDTPERSSKDSFCTGHSKEYNYLYDRMIKLHDDLVGLGFAVWRYKIESILLDEKFARTKGGENA